MVSQKEQEPLLAKDCPLRQVINIIGDKWTLPVLYVLTCKILEILVFAFIIEAIDRRNFYQNY